MQAALDGLRVVDLSSGPGGGIATMILADFGAEVIKVERAGGDPLRLLAAAPMWLRGKRSIELDLKTAAGRGRMHELVVDADVVVWSGRPGTAASLGADAETLRALNPRLIHCSITGFGPRGALARTKGYEGVVAAKAGRMMTFAGQLEREGPVYAYVQVGQHVVAQSTVHGILGALRVREQTGEGQAIETSLLQGMMPYDLGGLMTQQVMRRYPEQFPVDPNAQFGRMPTLQYHPVLTKDGHWIQLGNLVEHLFHAFIQAVDLTDIYTDTRYQGAPREYADDAREELRDKILRRMRERTASEWMEIFVENGNVAAEQFTDTQGALDHPQLIHTGDVVELETPRYGTMRQLGPVAKLGETPGEPSAEAPEVGEHPDAEWSQRPDHAAEPAGGAPHPRHPLEGVTVVEFATIIATPYACSILGDLGARVIKIEATEGDGMRAMMNGIGAVKTTASKQGICLNLKDPRGQEIAKELIAKADILIHNYRPGVPERLGIGYEQVREYNPQIVYVSATGYGSDGPYSHRPNAHPVPGALLGGAYMQAGGEAAMTVSDDIDVLRETARQLMRANEVNPDPNTSLVIVTGTLLALHVRQTQGIGQHVQVNMMGANAYANSDDFVSYAGKPPRPAPDRELYGLHSLYRLYRAAGDSWVFLACVTEQEWRSLTAVLGLDDVIADPRFVDGDARTANRAELATLLAEAFAARPADEWERLLTEADVACVRADEFSTAEFFDRSEHVLENGFVSEAEHLRWGPYWRNGSLVHFSATPPRLGAGILAGQHTTQLMRELGYQPDEIESLYSERIVASEVV